MEKFGERLEKALAIRELKASELAKLSGVNEGAISQYRKGAYEASQRNLEKLAETLRVSVPWLMGHDVPMEQSAKAELTNLFEQLTEEQAQTVLAVVQQMLAAVRKE